MEDEEDFANERSLLEIGITARGHECIFYPKFHCELNYIEFFWGAVKRYTRENCNYSFVDLEDMIKAGLNSDLPQSGVSPIGQSAGLMPISTVLMTGSRPLLRDKRDHTGEG